MGNFISLTIWLTEFCKQFPKLLRDRQTLESSNRDSLGTVTKFYPLFLLHNCFLLKISRRTKKTASKKINFWLSYGFSKLGYIRGFHKRKLEGDGECVSLVTSPWLLWSFCGDALNILLIGNIKQKSNRVILM